MSELKTCPFCLEAIPVRAIQCRYCESMINDLPPTAFTQAVPISSDKKRIRIAKKQSKIIAPAVINKKSSRWLLKSLYIMIFLIAVGAGYWLYNLDNYQQADQNISTDIRGYWIGTSNDNILYFQFMTNDMVNIAVPVEGFWFRTRYKIVDLDQNVYLELYHRNKAEWDRIAIIEFKDSDTITMTDTWDDLVIELERMPDDQSRDIFREVVNELDFHGW